MIVKNKQLPSSEPSFGILEEYSTLVSSRKALICDRLFLENFSRFQSTVKLIWPSASDDDVKKLEKFLKLVRMSSH